MPSTPPDGASAAALCSRLPSTQGFGQDDDVWKAQGRASFCAAIGLTCSLFAAVLPAFALFLALACWNLWVPYRLLDEAPYHSWPPPLQWAHIFSESLYDTYWNLFAPICLRAALRRPAASMGAPAWASWLLSCLPIPYLISLQLLGLYDPSRLTVHLPLNALWAGIVLVGGTPRGDAVGMPWARSAVLTGAKFLPFAVPVLTGILIRQLVFPMYASSCGNVLSKVIVVNMVVPAAFALSHRTAWWGCLQLVGQGYHPGNVSGILLLALMFESVHRRVLLCATNSMRLTLVSSLNLGLVDTLMQLSIDFRDALTYICLRWKRPPPELFEDMGRRRLRADCLILHLMCEHLAIIMLSSWLLVTQVRVGEPGSAIGVTIVNLVVQIATRFAFDVITFHVEARYGSIMRKLFRVEQWHGIAVHEVWQRRKWGLICMPIRVALLCAGACMFYLKGFLLTAWHVTGT